MCGQLITSRPILQSNIYLFIYLLIYQLTYRHNSREDERSPVKISPLYEETSITHSHEELKVRTISMRTFI